MRYFGDIDGLGEAADRMNIGVTCKRCAAVGDDAFENVCFDNTRRDGISTDAL